MSKKISRINYCNTAGFLVQILVWVCIKIGEIRKRNRDNFWGNRGNRGKRD